MSIEQKIKDEISQYEIKTSSDKILSMLPKKEKRPSYFKRYSMAFACFAVILLICIPLGIHLSKGGVNPDTPIEIQNNSAKLNESTLLSTMSVQLFYGGHMLDTKENSIPTNLKMKNTTPEDFTRAQAQFTKVFPLIEPFFSNSSGLESVYQSIDFTYDSIEYKYKLEVDEYQLYLKQDILSTKKKIDALYVFDTTYYKGTIQGKQEIDESEIEMVIYKENQEIHIERNFEKEEYSIEYQILENNKEIESYEIEIEYEDNQLVCSYEYESKAMELELEIHKTNSEYTIIYKEDGSYDISLEMVYDSISKEYNLKEK